MRAAGLEVHVDGAGNLVGVLEGSEGGSALVTGSHTDTVLGRRSLRRHRRRARRTRGVRCLAEAGVRLRHDLWIVDFYGEEPNDFGLSCLGSRAVAGNLSAAHLDRTDGPGAPARRRHDRCRHRPRPGALGPLEPRATSRRSWSATSSRAPVSRQKASRSASCLGDRRHRPGDRELPGPPRPRRHDAGRRCATTRRARPPRSSSPSSDSGARVASARPVASSSSRARRTSSPSTRCCGSSSAASSRTGSIAPVTSSKPPSPTAGSRRGVLGTRSIGPRPKLPRSWRTSCHERRRGRGGRARAVGHEAAERSRPRQRPARDRSPRPGWCSSPPRTAGAIAQRSSPKLADVAIGAQVLAATLAHLDETTT